MASSTYEFKAGDKNILIRKAASDDISQLAKIQDLYYLNDPILRSCYRCRPEAEVLHRGSRKGWEADWKEEVEFSLKEDAPYVIYIAVDMDLENVGSDVEVRGDPAGIVGYSRIQVLREGHAEEEYTSGPMFFEEGEPNMYPRFANRLEEITYESISKHTEKGTGYCHVLGTCVHPDYKGKGIESELLRSGLAEVSPLKLHIAALDSDDWEEIYRKFSFELVAGYNFPLLSRKCKAILFLIKRP